MSSSKQAQRILRAAAKLFANRGYEGTSMRDLAKALGVTLPTIYLYFDNKRALYEATCAAVFSTRGEMHGAHLVAPGDDRTRLYRYVSSLATDFLEDKLYNKLMHREMIEQDTHGLRVLSQKVFHDSLSRAGEMLQRLCPGSDGYFRIFVTVSLVFGMVSTLRFGQYLHRSLKEVNTAPNIARLALAQVIPEITWSDIEQSKPASLSRRPARQANASSRGLDAGSKAPAFKAKSSTRN